MEAEKTAIRECGKYIRKYIDRERIVRLWEHEAALWTQQTIADVCKCSVATVRRVLREEGFEQTYTYIDGTVVKKIWHFRGREWAQEEAE